MTDYNPADIADINVNDLLMGYNNKTEMWTIRTVTFTCYHDDDVVSFVHNLETSYLWLLDLYIDLWMSVGKSPS